MSSIKVKLAGMNFLEFAVWGAYLTSLGIYLAGANLGDKIYWFYTVQGIVSIFMPAIVGIVADRWIQAQRMLSLCRTIHGRRGILLQHSGNRGICSVVHTIYRVGSILHADNRSGQFSGLHRPEQIGT